jgi:hypothetical protein
MTHSRSRDTRDVGILDVATFDWGALFAFDFSDVDEDAEDPILHLTLDSRVAAVKALSAVPQRRWLENGFGPHL